MYEGLNEKQNQNHGISTSKNELFFVIVPKIVKSEKMQFSQFFQFFQDLGKIGIFSRNFSNFSGKVSTTTNTIFNDMAEHRSIFENG